MRAVSSFDPVTTCLPSGVTHTESTLPLCPSRVRTCEPSDSSQMRAVLSSEPVTTCLPSGVTHTDHTMPVCPSSVRTCEPSDSCQMRAVQSADAVTTCFPSGVTHTERTLPVCPSRLRTCEPSDSSQMRAVSSVDPVTTCFPSGVTHTESTLMVCPSNGTDSPSRRNASRSPPFSWSSFRRVSRISFVTGKPMCSIAIRFQSSATSASLTPAVFSSPAMTIPIRSIASWLQPSSTSVFTRAARCPGSSPRNSSTSLAFLTTP